MTAPEFTPTELLELARFEAAPDAPESIRDRVARALNHEGAWCGLCDYEGGIDACPDCQQTLLMYADAAIAVLKGPDQGAVIGRVLALADDYDDGSEWGAALYRGDAIRAAIRAAISGPQS